MVDDVPSLLVTVTAMITAGAALLTAARLFSAELRKWRKTENGRDNAD